MFAKDELGWGPTEMSNYKIAEGVGGFVAGKNVQAMAGVLGKRGTIQIGNALSAVCWLLIGTAKSTSQVFAGLACLFPLGAYKRPALETALTKLADKRGIGQGKLQADLANLVAVIKIIAPMLYLRAYEWGKKNTRSKTAAVPLFLYSAYFVGASAVFSTVPKGLL